MLAALVEEVEAVLLAAPASLVNPSLVSDGLNDVESLPVESLVAESLCDEVASLLATLEYDVSLLAEAAPASRAALGAASPTDASGAEPELVGAGGAPSAS